MKKLQEILDQAIHLFDNGEDSKAIELNKEIISEKNDWSAPHYNLGLIYKYQLNWELSFKHNYKAFQLEPENEATQWNLGIAATILNEWKIARRCWNNFGMNYEESNIEPIGNLGLTPIRLNQENEGEVIWA